MFDIHRAEEERSKALGTESEAWQRYLRIRNLVLEMGPVLGMARDDRDGWNAFVFVAEAFPPDPEPADEPLELEAKQFLNRFLQRSGTLLLDAHEAALLYDQLLTQDRLEPHEVIDRMGKLPEYPLEPEIMAALISVVPQRDPDIQIPKEDLDA